MHRWMIWLGILLLVAMATLYRKSNWPDKRIANTTRDWVPNKESTRLTRVPLGSQTVVKTMPIRDVHPLKILEGGRMCADGPAFEPVTQPIPKIRVGSAATEQTLPRNPARSVTESNEKTTPPRREAWLGKFRESQPGFAEPNRLDVRVLPGGRQVLARTPLPPYQ